MKIYTRNRWGARTPRGMASQSNFSNGGFVHWTDSITRGVDSLKEQSSAMRAIQDFHMDVRKWSDIGYHYVVFQPSGPLNRARVFEGRNFSRIPAAQEGHNTDTLAVSVFMGEGDKLSPKTKAAILAVFAKHGIGSKHIKCHGDVMATDCPGPLLKTWVHSL